MVAETTELSDRFTRIVTTDDQGRYLVPDLPSELRRVRAGLWACRFVADQGHPGRADLRPAAPDGRAAAQIYPSYWLSLLKSQKGLSEQNVLGRVRSARSAIVGRQATREIPRPQRCARLPRPGSAQVAVGRQLGMVGAYVSLATRRRCSPTGPTALPLARFPEGAAHRRPRAQSGRDAVGLTKSKPGGQRRQRRTQPNAQREQTVYASFRVTICSWVNPVTTELNRSGFPTQALPLRPILTASPCSARPSGKGRSAQPRHGPVGKGVAGGARRRDGEQWRLQAGVRTSSRSTTDARPAADR